MRFDWEKAFYEIKRFFPGDPDWSIHNFYQLPYEYVVGTYSMVNKMRTNELHMYEQPQALQTSMIANANRDPKQRKKPYTLADFYMFQPPDQRDIPSERYAAAYQKMLEDKILPRWALFVFASLRNESGAPAPEPTYLMGDGVLLLAPVWGEGSVTGMLIAQERQQGPMELLDSYGTKHLCVVPEVPTKVVAQEEAEVRLLQ